MAHSADMIRTRLVNIADRFRVDYHGDRIDYQVDRWRLIIREFYFRASSRFTPSLETEADGMHFRVRTYDRGVSMTTFVAGPPEAEFLPAITRLVRELSPRSEPPESTFLEIGANIGTATVVALRSGGFERAECFEPMPDNTALLRENLELNGLDGRARIHQVALSDSEGTVDFEISPTNSGDGRVRHKSEPGILGEQDRKVVQVTASQLDTFLTDGTIDLDRIGLAWIDAQGGEGGILAGGQRLLESDVPVIVEFWPYGIDRAGGRGLFTEAVQANYPTVIDIADPADPVTYDSSEMDSLFEKYGQGSFFDPAGAHSYTNLLLL